MKRIILILIIATCAGWLGFHTVRAIGKKRAVTASVAPIEQPAAAAYEVVDPPATIAAAPPAVEMPHESSTPKAPLVANEEVRSIAAPESRLSTPEPSPPPILTSTVGTVEENEIVWASPAEKPAAQLTATVATTATIDAGEDDIGLPPATTPVTQSTTTVTTATTSTTATSSTEDADEIWTSRNLRFSARRRAAAAAPSARPKSADERGSLFDGGAPRKPREEVLPSGVVESLTSLAESQRGGPMTNATASAAGDDSLDIESLVQRFPYLHRRIKGAVVIPVPPTVFTDAAERAAFETETSKLVAVSALSALLVPASLHDTPFYVEKVEALRRELETTAHTIVRPYSYQPRAPIPSAATGIELVVIPAH